MNSSYLACKCMWVVHTPSPVSWQMSAKTGDDSIIIMRWTCPASIPAGTEGWFAGWQTFAASSAGERPVWVVTERAVFRLRPGAGLELVEVRLYTA